MTDDRKVKPLYNEFTWDGALFLDFLQRTQAAFTSISNGFEPLVIRPLQYLIAQYAHTTYEVVCWETKQRFEHAQTEHRLANQAHSEASRQWRVDKVLSNSMRQHPKPSFAALTKHRQATHAQLCTIAREYKTPRRPRFCKMCSTVDQWALANFPHDALRTSDYGSTYILALPNSTRSIRRQGASLTWSLTSMAATPAGVINSFCRHDSRLAQQLTLFLDLHMKWSSFPLASSLWKAIVSAHALTRQNSEQLLMIMVLVDLLTHKLISCQ